MKQRIALGVGLLLTLGTSVAGSYFYGQDQASETAHIAVPASNSVQREVTPEMIAMWKATAATTDYTAPKAPI